MWSKDKARNRRLERDRVLDVKVRSKQARRRRLRRCALGLLATGFTAGMFYLIWIGSEWLLNRAIFENEAFAVRRLEIQSDGTLQPEMIQSWAGVRHGDNLFALDLTRVQRDLELVPLVERAAIERVLPDTLKIRVTERKAMARVSVYQPRAAEGGFEASMLLLDASGYVVVPLNTIRDRRRQQDLWALPELTGVARTELRPGAASESSQVQAALRFIMAFERSPLMGHIDLERVDLSVPGVITAITRHGSQVTVAIDDTFAVALRRWKLIHDYGREQGKMIDTLDLSISRNVPLVWQKNDAPSGASAANTSKTVRTHDYV